MCLHESEINIMLHISNSSDARCFHDELISGRLESALALCRGKIRALARAGPHSRRIDDGASMLENRIKRPLSKM